MNSPIFLPISQIILDMDELQKNSRKNKLQSKGGGLEITNAFKKVPSLCCTAEIKHNIVKKKKKKFPEITGWPQAEYEPHLSPQLILNYEKLGVT